MNSSRGIGTDKKKAAAGREDQLAADVIRILDRWDDRLQGHNNEKREGGRNRFRAKILVKVPAVLTSKGSEASPESTIEVWARNISRGGVGFVSRKKIVSDAVIVCLDPRAQAQKWYHGVIVRRRGVQNEFWEYGVQLTGPAGDMRAD